MKTIELDVQVDELALKATANINAQALAAEILNLIGEHMTANYPEVYACGIIHDTFNEPIN
jgi:hypothetical protein